ncbi:lipid II flippase Amj family protein [Salipiger sp.]|uniref:lipid II flippase Amj family protein n=1 Tax=Salipiger sp. TaxID=2078585 RepID=UPI003A973D33
MDSQLAVILALTFVIHLIGTLAYAFRIAGVRTGHLAIAFSLFNSLVLISRLSNAFQGPLLAKRVELAIAGSVTEALRHDLMLVLVAASAATLAGGVLLPSFQRMATVSVAHFHRRRSMLKLLRRTLSPAGVSAMLRAATLPRYATLRGALAVTDLPLLVIGLNFAATALWTVGVLASVYAGVITPELRVTAASLSSLVNGVATIVMFVFIDPHVSAMTDDAASGRSSEGHLRRLIFWMVASRFAGTLAAQALLVPSAAVIAKVAEVL